MLSIPAVTTHKWPLVFPLILTRASCCHLSPCRAGGSLDCREGSVQRRPCSTASQWGTLAHFCHQHPVYPWTATSLSEPHSPHQDRGIEMASPSRLWGWKAHTWPHLGNTEAEDRVVLERGDWQAGFRGDSVLKMRVGGGHGEM